MTNVKVNERWGVLLENRRGKVCTSSRGDGMMRQCYINRDVELITPGGQLLGYTHCYPFTLWCYSVSWSRCQARVPLTRLIEERNNGSACLIYRYAIHYNISFVSHEISLFLSYSHPTHLYLGY